MSARNLSGKSPGAAWSLIAASSKGVASSQFFAFGFALLWSSAAQTSKCSSFAAKWSGVQPSSSMAFTSAPAHKSLRTHSREPAWAENMSAVMPTSCGGAWLMRPPPAPGMSSSSGFCGFITKGRRVSVQAPLSSASLRPLRLPSRECCNNSWFASTDSETSALPRLATAMEFLKPFSKTWQPITVSSLQDDALDLSFLRPSSSKWHVPWHAAATSRP
mmetsp:Transcript_58608/g.164410  ORF Transcript_58608/g.164410 Transcript_58608/m.164410 type:complete len:218 (-) Transcript_58608:68-721(-)